MGLSVSAHPKILCNGSDTFGYTLYESYAVKGGAPITTKITEWHPRNETVGNMRLFKDILEKRSNLNGALVRYSWFHNPPFVRFVKDSSGSVVDYVGFYVDIFEELKSQLNFAGRSNWILYRKWKYTGIRT